MKNAETAEKAYRSSDYFYEREKEKAGYVLEEARKGLSIIERRQAAQACKMLIEEQKRDLIEKFGLPKNRDDWDKDTAQTAEHIFRQGIAEATIRGAVLKIVAKSDVLPLIAGQRLPYDAKMAKRAKHDGGTYFWALTVLMEDRYSGISTEKDTQYEKSRVYTSADRRKIQQRVRKMLKKYPFEQSMDGSVYRPLVVSFLPMAQFKLYMAQPKKCISEEHLQQALEGARRAGAGYAELVSRYSEGDFGNGFSVLVPSIANTKYTTFDAYLQDFLKTRTAGEGLLPFAINSSRPRSEKVQGVLVTVSPEGTIIYPDYLKNLETCLHMLTDAGLDTDVYTDGRTATVSVSYDMKKRGEVTITSAGCRADMWTKKLTDTITALLSGRVFTHEELTHALTTGEAQGIPEYLEADTRYVLEVLDMCKEVVSIDTTYHEADDAVVIRALNDADELEALLRVGLSGVDKRRSSTAVKKAFRRHEYEFGY